MSGFIFSYGKVTDVLSLRTATEEASDRASSSTPAPAHEQARAKAEPIEVGVQGDMRTVPSYTGYGYQGASPSILSPPRLFTDFGDLKLPNDFPRPRLGTSMRTLALLLRCYFEERRIGRGFARRCSRVLVRRRS